MSTLEINYRGLTLEVTGRLIREDGDGRNDPRVAAYAEIDSVTLEGVDIGELLSAEQWEDIETRVLEAANELQY